LEIITNKSNTVTGGVVDSSRKSSFGNDTRGVDVEDSGTNVNGSIV